MSKKYQAYGLHNIHKVPQFQKLPANFQFELQVVAKIYPFRTNNYIIEELIDWNDPFNDPIFKITFPHKAMLIPEHYQQMATAIKNDTKKIEVIANQIRFKLNPHPAGQLEHNTPVLYDQPLEGIQHKYRETLLFFPQQGQTCHAFCSFCFRWPQFVGINDLKISSKEIKPLIDYIAQHPEISDILFTGGDPLIMKTKVLAKYINALLDANIHHLKNIRIGTKVLSFWPYRFLTDNDADDLLELFSKVIKHGKKLAFMAHFNHPKELKSLAIKQAIQRILATGAEIRTQSPLLAGINDQAEIWAEMWNKQIELGCIPYYMFCIRDTGAQHYFGVPLINSWEIFRKAYQSVTGLARTVRGPSISTFYGKIQIVGVSEINNEKLMVLQFLQARNPQWVGIPFFAKYDDKASWLDELTPFENETFFFENND